MLLITNVLSLQLEAKSSCSVSPLVKPTLFANNTQTSISENESSKTKVQKQPQRKSKLSAKTAISKSEDNFSSESETENSGKEPIKLGPMKYGCSFCSKIMPNSYGMKMHIFTHTGEKPFSCEFCEYETNQKASLEKHLRCKHSQK